MTASSLGTVTWNASCSFKLELSGLMGVVRMPPREVISFLWTIDDLKVNEMIYLNSSVREGFAAQNARVPLINSIRGFTNYH